MRINPKFTIVIRRYNSQQLLCHLQHLKSSPGTCFDATFIAKFQYLCQYVSKSFTETINNIFLPAFT